MGAVTTAPSARGAAGAKGRTRTGVAVGAAAGTVRGDNGSGRRGITGAETGLTGRRRAVGTITSTPAAGGAAVTKGGASAGVAVSTAASAIGRYSRASSLSTAAECLDRSQIYQAQRSRKLYRLAAGTAVDSITSAPAVSRTAVSEGSPSTSRSNSTTAGAVSGLRGSLGERRGCD
jgi:hypothetical protein